MRFCALSSGSDGNAIFMEHKRSKILIDCGRSGKYIAACLSDIGVDARELTGILVTHEHSDHTSGIGVMSRRYDIPIYATAGTWEGMRGLLGGVKQHNIHIVSGGETIDLGDVSARSFPIPHDANEPVGYRLNAGETIVAIATDIGHLCPQMVDGVTGADVVLLESNHDVERVKNSSYPAHLKKRILGRRGHLCNEDASRFAAYLARMGSRYITLGHLSAENNTPKMAMSVLVQTLVREGINWEKDLCLSVANRGVCGEMICV